MFNFTKLLIRLVILFVFVIGSPIIFIVSIALSSSLREAIDTTIEIIKAPLEN